RRKAAQSFGATDLLDPGTDDVAASVREATGVGTDYAFETAGRASLVQTGLLATRNGGTVVCVGAPPITENIEPSPAARFTVTEKTLLGCLLGSSNSLHEIPRLVALWRAGRLDLAGLVTARRPLSEIDAAFADLRAGRGIRTVLSVDGLVVHRAMIAQAHPALRVAVDHPERDGGEDREGDRDADQRDEEQPGDRNPEYREPEGADLPAVVRLRPGATRVAALHVVQDHRSDRRHAPDEAPDYRRGADERHHDREAVEGVDQPGDAQHRGRRLAAVGLGQGGGHGSSSFWPSQHSTHEVELRHARSKGGVAGRRGARRALARRLLARAVPRASRSRVPCTESRFRGSVGCVP